MPGRDSETHSGRLVLRQHLMITTHRNSWATNQSVSL